MGMNTTIPKYMDVLFKILRIRRIDKRHWKWMEINWFKNKK